MVSKYKETEIGSIPEEWDVTSLSDAFQNLEAGVSVNSDERQNADFFVLKTSAISDGLINIDEAKPVVKKEYARLKCPVKKGSIIISRMNTPQLVGACGYVAEDAKGYFLPDRLWQVINSKPEKYDFRWLNYLLNQYRYKNAIHAVATGTSNSMKNISKERLLEIRIPRPSIEEQKFIVKAISDIEALIYVLMKMIGADDNLEKAIQCQITANSIDSDKWKAVDWMEWQAKGVAPRILMPARPTRLKADQLLAVYGGADDASIAAYENVIDELAELFDVSRQAAKVRLMDLGYPKAEGAYPFVDGQYVRGYSFEAGALDKNQTFTIPYADLFKAYCFDREFKKLIDSGQFIFADRHLVLDNEKYIARDQSGNATLSEYALSHMDECCVVFSKGYSYQSKYQGARYYTQFMRNAAPVENQVEYSFELNAHNKTLLEQIKNAKRRSEAMRRYPGSFAETLVALQKERKLSNKQLADRSLVGEKNHSAFEKR